MAIESAWNEAGDVGWVQSYVYLRLVLGFGIVMIVFFLSAQVCSFRALISDIAFVLSSAGRKGCEIRACLPLTCYDEAQHFTIRIAVGYMV